MRHPAVATETIEEGDIFFFYRPRVEAEKVRGREDVQRFYMALAPKRPRRYRLFLIGRKKLPEVIPGRSHPERRNWAINVLTSERPDDLRRELLAVEYPTETRGERTVQAAKPVAEGRYKLVRHKDHTELAYALELPEEPGPAQEEFEIKAEGSFIVSIKNPAVAAPGLPAPSKPPEYTRELKERFGSRRWINVDDPTLLDYENTQLLLLGAHAEDVEEELGITIDQEHETLRSAEVCRELKLSCEREPVRPLVSGEFPAREKPAAGAAGRTKGQRTQEVRRLSPEESPTSRSKAGGRAANTRAPSASAVMKLLGGIDFPSSQSELFAYARLHRDRLEEPREALQVIGELPDREYRGMVDVAKALGEIR